MRFSQHTSVGLTGPSGSFVLFLTFALAAMRLVTAVALRDGNRSPLHLFARNDETYPDDYPYPKKADIPSSVTTAKDKSLFYTFMGPKGGATSKQLTAFVKSESVHVVGDTKFTIPDGYDKPKPVKDSNGDPDYTKSGDYYMRFIDELSTVFADKSSGEVFLLLPLSMDGANLGGNIACATTWVRKEFDALTANQNVEKITQVDPGDFTKRKQIHPATGSKLFRRDNSGQACHDYEAGTPPNLVPPPTGYDDDNNNAASSAPKAASQPQSVANPVCDQTNTYALSDTQGLATLLTEMGTSQCCTSTSGDCATLTESNYLIANLCGPTGHFQQCTDCAKLGEAMNNLNIDCQKNYKVGGKVAIPYLDQVTLELQAQPGT